MYEALVARIRYYIQKANFMGLKEAESTLLLGESADAIEELLSERDEVNADSWKTAFEVERDEHRLISVTERLPNQYDGGLYICLIVGGEYDQFSWYELCDFAEGRFWTKESESECHVTHWMRLPQEPKEEI